MKKLLALALAVLMLLSLCACGAPAQSEATPTPEPTPEATPEPTPEPTPEVPVFNCGEAVEALGTYIKENGFVLGNVSTITLPAPDNVISFLAAQDDTVLLAFTAEDTYGDVVTSYTTSLYFHEDMYGTVYHSATAEFNGTELGTSSEGFIIPHSFTATTEPTLTITKSNLPDPGLTPEFIARAQDNLNSMLELLTEVLASSGLDLTLTDFGFTAYEIDPNRESYVDITPPEPAPIAVQSVYMQRNSAGTPEFWISFQNTGSAPLEAFDFVIIAYNAYGEQLSAHGFGDNYFAGTYVDSIAPGGYSRSDYYYSLYGMETVASIDIAILRYKLEGQDAVTLGDSLNDPYLAWSTFDVD